MKRFLTRLVIPAGILAASVTGAVILVRSAESAERQPPTTEPPLVETAVATASRSPARIVGSGVVEPSREVTIAPEVGGKLAHVSESLVVGGRLSKGQLLARLDGKSYRLAVRERQSQVEQARLEIQLEQSRGDIARREWTQLRQDTPSSEANPLALRAPQARAAAVALESAQAALDRAELDQSRTALYAPFNATVASESVEVGEFVAPGSPVATLIGTDAFWVRVSLPLENLPLIDIPGLGATTGSSATIRQSLGNGPPILRQGRVVRLINELDRENREAQLLIEVTDPLDPPPGQLPLLPGAFVSVEIEGKVVRDLVAVPRGAIDGHGTWVVRADETLERRTLVPAWSTTDEVFVIDGVADGERLVLTDLPAMTEGMRVRTAAPAHDPASPTELAEAEPVDATAEIPSEVEG